MTQLAVTEELNSLDVTDVRQALVTEGAKSIVVTDDGVMVMEAGIRGPQGASGSGGGSATWGGITGTLSSQTDLQAALDGKAAAVHGHAIADVTGLQTALDGKASSSHTHAIADVTGLQTALDGKQAAGSYETAGAAAAAISTHLAAGDPHPQYLTPAEGNAAYQPLATVLTNTTAAFTTAQETKLAGIAAGATVNSPDATLLDRANHTGSQAISTVTGLQAALDGKADTSHTHTASQITDFAEATDDRVSSLLVAGSNITLTYDDVANTLTIAAAGGGGGSFDYGLSFAAANLIRQG